MLRLSGRIGPGSYFIGLTIYFLKTLTMVQYKWRIAEQEGVAYAEQDHNKSEGE